MIDLENQFLIFFRVVSKDRFYCKLYACFKWTLLFPYRTKKDQNSMEITASFDSSECNSHLYIFQKGYDLFRSFMTNLKNIRSVPAFTTNTVKTLYLYWSWLFHPGVCHYKNFICLIFDLAYAEWLDSLSWKLEPLLAVALNHVGIVELFRYLHQCFFLCLLFLWPLYVLTFYFIFDPWLLLCIFDPFFFLIFTLTNSVSLTITMVSKLLIFLPLTLTFTLLALSQLYLSLRKTVQTCLRWLVLPLT